MGMLTSNREIKIIMNFIEKEAIPCFVILRKDKTSKICKISQVELNCEGYLTKDVVMALLYESSENFEHSKEIEKTFIRNFEAKMKRRTQVATNRINGGLIPPPSDVGHMAQPQP